MNLNLANLDGAFLLTMGDYGKVEDVKILLISEVANQRRSLIRIYLDWVSHSANQYAANIHEPIRN